MNTHSTARPVVPAYGTPPPPAAGPGPGGPGEGTTTRPGVRVHAQQIIDGLHARYGRTIAQMIQENAEISAALDTTQAALAEAHAKLAALTDLDTVVDSDTAED